MTETDRSIPFDVYQSFSQLRDKLDGLACLAGMIPEGEPDVFDYASFGYLLRMVSDSLHSTLEVHFSTLHSEFVKH